MVAARSFLSTYYTDPLHGPVLRFYRDEFHIYDKRRYLIFHEPDLRARLIEDLDGWVRNIYKGLVTNVLECLKSLVLVDWNVERPCWLGSDRDKLSYLAMENGLLDLNAAIAGEADCLHPPSPK